MPGIPKTQMRRPSLLAPKKANPWGLHDMHGNVGEWVLDEYMEDGYEKWAGKKLTSAEAIMWPTKLYPRVVKGGSWDSSAEECRAAAKLGSEDEDWKLEDPNIPLSPWWFTSGPALAIGFRVIRPLEAPAEVTEQEKFWKADLEEIQDDVDFRIEEEGRGALGIVNPQLPADILKLEKVQAENKKK